MYFFVNFDNPSKSKNYDKGILFERLCKDIISYSGYNDVEMRQKSNNLEFDITAKHKLTRKALVGEAKAMSKKISDEIMVFFTKMMMYWKDDKDTLGVFISISELTPESKGFMDKLISDEHNFVYMTGDEILDKLVTDGNYVSLEQVKKLSNSITNMKAGDTHFLISDRGNYFIQLLIHNNSTLPSEFIVFDKLGQQIKEKAFLETLKSQIDVLKELDISTNDDIINVKIGGDEELKYETSVFLGVVSGDGWFDYQFPAPPDKFVGREKVIKEYMSFLEDIRLNKSKYNVCEIISKSGVGKSSITLKLNSYVNEQDDLGIVIDSRNLRTEIELLQLYQTLVKEVNSKFSLNIAIPMQSKMISICLQEIDSYLKSNNKIAVIFLDQFESIFPRVSVYNNILDTIVELMHGNTNIIFSISRKNDQPTTYDDAYEIDLGRLMQISKTFPLKDFNNEEAELLINKMNTEMGTSLISSLREQVLEISNGFPWLLKKYCNHIINLVNNGNSQREIYESDMQLEDLFEEEIESMDELLKDFFNRLIYYLPATHYELSEVFSEEDLYQKLRILQNDYRLIRLTGRTYDTYNDVLKEYVKTGKVLITKRYIFRMHPNAVIKFFEQIIENNWSSIQDVMGETNEKKGAIYNKLRELKRVELIDGRGDDFKVVEQARIAFDESTLHVYLNNVLKKNSIVREIIHQVLENKQVTIEEVRRILIKEMPFIKASESTWLNYSRAFSNWLKIGNIIEYKSNLLYKSEDEISINSNQSNYLPSIYMPQLEKFLSELATSDNAKDISKVIAKMGRKSMNGAVTDAKFLNLVDYHSRGVYLLKDNGKEFIKAHDHDRKAFIKSKIEDIAHIKKYVEKVKNGPYKDEAFSELLKELHIFDWTESTKEWRHKLLKNWLYYSGLLSKGKK